MKDKDLIYQLDGKPPLRVAIPLGLQHVLAMFTGNIAPIIIIANILDLPMEQKTFMIQCAMIISGVVTMIQLYPIGRIGAKLPLVMGTSFAFVPTAIAVGKSYGLSGILGASFIGAFAEILMGLFIRPLRRFFPPLVTGVVLIAIGLSLMPTGIKYFAGGVGAKDFGSVQNLILGSSVLLIIILLQRFTKGLLSLSSVLIALVIGYIMAMFMGKISFEGVVNATWLSFPMPLKYGMTFHWDAIFKFAAVYLVVGLETLGNISGITLAGENREATENEMSGAVLADAFGSALAAIFNVLPNTAYGQNAGIVAMTKVTNRFCVATGAVFLIVAGIFPKFGAICAAMPASVLGGAVVIVFAMITISGIKMVTRDGLGSRDTMVLAISLGLGLGFSSVPEALELMPYALKFILEDAVVSCGLIALILNVVFPKETKIMSSATELDLEADLS